MSITNDLLFDGLLNGSPIALLTQGLLIPDITPIVRDRVVFIVEFNNRSYGVSSREC